MQSEIELLLINDETITVDSTFNGDAEEGVVVGVFAAGSGKRCTGRSASGECKCHGCSDCDDEKLFHIELPSVVLFENPLVEFSVYTIIR